MREREILKRIYGLVKPYRTSLILAGICMILVAGFSAAQAYVVKPLLDEIFFNRDRFLLNVIPLLLVAIFVCKGFFFYSYTYTLSAIGQGIVTDMRKKLYAHVHSLPLSFFQKTPTGELISRIISDVMLVQGAVSHACVASLKDMFQVVGLIGVVFYQNWRLALISMVFLPMALIPIVHFGRRHRRLSTKTQQATALVSNILYETITGSRIVKAFCMENYENNRFARLVDKLFGISLKDSKVEALAHPLMEILGGIGVALIMWYGGREVLNGTSTPGTFFSFLTAIIMIYEPVKGISKVNSRVQRGIAAAVRVFELLDMAPEIMERPDAHTLAPLRRQIDLKNVSFSYDGKTDVLHNINLSVKAGQVLAIVGPSGSGKTTLVNLIPRFFEVTTGCIEFDGCDVRDATLKSLRQQIGIVTQQTILFNDTVRNNIAYGDPERPDEEILAAAKAAHALDFINMLPEGLDSIIGESGNKLSGGERQRISIARALLKNAPILILDEATSSLDTESEREVQRALENLMKDRTTFVIAHRLSTIRNADRIVVLQDGRIVEDGSHDALLAQEGVYAMLHQLQY